MALSSSGIIIGYNATLDVRCDARLLVVSGTAPDHPVAAAFPHGRYLKTAFVSAGAEGSGPGRSGGDLGGRTP